MDGDKKVKVRELKTGASNEQSTVVSQGLVAGDRVVLEGTDRLRDGAEVEVVSDSKDVPAGPGQQLQGKPGKNTDESASVGKAENSRA
jgi:multidrug efflux system membrane fusion protein